MEDSSACEELARRVEELEVERHRREATEIRLRLSKQRWERLVETVPCALYDYILSPDGTGRFVYMSSQCANIFEIEADQVVENSDLLWSMVHPDDLDRLKEEDQKANQAQRLFRSEVRVNLPSGTLKWIQLTSMPSREKVNDQTLWSGVILDVTERKLVEEERDRLVSELQRALAEVKTLSGFLPICASCKKIRDDKGYWNQIESYISTHSEAQFSHGICPDCITELYPDLVGKE